MRRIQLHLDEDLDEALTRRAIERGVAKAVLIREVLRAAVPQRGRADDPSLALLGIYDGHKGDSSAIDEVVYGA